MHTPAQPNTPAQPQKGDVVAFYHPTRGHRIGQVVSRCRNGGVRVRWPVGATRAHLITLAASACTVQAPPAGVHVLVDVRCCSACLRQRDDCTCDAGAPTGPPVASTTGKRVVTVRWQPNPKSASRMDLVAVSPAALGSARQVLGWPLGLLGFTWACWLDGKQTGKFRTQWLDAQGRCDGAVADDALAAMALVVQAVTTHRPELDLRWGPRPELIVGGCRD